METVNSLEHEISLLQAAAVTDGLKDIESLEA